MYKVEVTQIYKNFKEKKEINTMTQREMYESIKTKLTDAEEIAFIDEKIAQIDAKAAKAKVRAAAKKEEGDALRETVFSMLTGAPKTIPQICEEINDEAITEAKIRARLSQLVQLERVAKEKIKTDAGEKMGYYIPADAQ